MRKHIFSIIIVLFFLCGVIFVCSKVFAHNDTADQPLPQESSGPAGSQGEYSSPDALTSLTVSNPYCYQPNPAVDSCSINLRYIQAIDDQTNPPYMTWLAISISNKSRYNGTAFFEGTIYYSYDMIPDGLTVPCGAPNAGGAGDLYGYVYSVYIQPLDSSRNPMATDIANATCPAFSP